MPAEPLAELRRDDPAVGKFKSLFGPDMMIEADALTPAPRNEGNQGDENDDQDDLVGGEEGQTPAGEREPKPKEADQGEETPPEEESDETPKVKRTKVRDKEYDLPEEVADELEKGTLRLQDYTRKTQEVSESRKKLETEDRPKVLATLQKYSEGLAQIEQIIKASTPAEPDWNDLRRKVSAEEFQATLAEWQLHERKMTKLADAKKEADAALQTETSAAMEREAGALIEKLHELLPDWKDEKKGIASRQQIMQYASTLGYTVNDLTSIRDARLFVVLSDAAAYRRLKAGTKPGEQIRDKTAPPPVMRPGAATSTTPRAPNDVVKAVKKAAKTGSVEDAGRAMKHFID